MVQSQIRRWLYQTGYQKGHRALVNLQSHVRRYMSVRRVQKLRAAIVCQATARRFLVEMRHLARVEAACCIQNAFQRSRLRRKHAKPANADAEEDGDTIYPDFVDSNLDLGIQEDPGQFVANWDRQP